MKEGTVLEQTRRWALWVALGSAVLTLLISLLALWDVVSLIDFPSTEDIFAALALQSLAGEFAGELGGELGPLGGEMFGGFDIPGPEVTVWGRLLGTFSALLTTSGIVLLSLLVASHVRKGEK